MPEPAKLQVQRSTVILREAPRETVSYAERHGADRRIFIGNDAIFPTRLLAPNPT